MMNNRLTRAAAAVAAASIIGVWSPQLGYELGLSGSNRAEAATTTVVPSGVKVDVGNTKLFPYWTANTDGVVSYRVTYVPLGAVGAILGASRNVVVTAPANYATITGVTNGTSYSVTVSAVYGDGSESNASSTVTATPTGTIPVQPTALVATAGDTKVTLGWTLPSDNSRKRVDVYRDGAFLASMAAAGTQSYVDTAVVNYTTYSYQIVAVNTTSPPFVRSESSTAASAKPVDLTPPAAPQGVTATPTDKRLRLNWTANTETDFDHYVVEGPVGTKVDVTGTSYTATGLTNGVNYTYSVSAVDRVGNPSAGTSVTAKPVDNVAPDVPTGLAVQAADSALDATWNASAATDTAGYKLYVDGVYKSTVAAGTTSARITGLTNGTSYRVQVSAVDAIPNESALSAQVSGTPVDLTAPSAPTAFVATAGDGSASFSWRASPEVDVVRYVVRGATGQTVATVARTATTASISGLTNGTSYTYTVVAVDAAGNVSAASNSSTVTPRDTTPPSVPTNVTGTAGDTKVTLTWTGSPEADTHHYVVRNGAGTTVATIPVGTTTATITGLTNDVAVTFTVAAVDALGNVSAASSAVSLTPRDTTPPSTPMNLAGFAGDTKATLVWSGSPETDTDHYDVRNAAGTTIATVPAGTTTVTVSGLVNNTTASYTVVAVDRSGNVSAATAPVSVTPRDTTPPSAPTALTAVAGDTRAVLSWTASPDSDTDHYLVRNAAGTAVASVPAGTTTVTITGLVNDTVAKFTVAAVDTAGNTSTASNQVSVTPKDTTAPSAPAGFSATAGDTTAAVRWTASPEPDVHHYLVRNGAGTVLATVAAGTTATTITGLANDTAVTLSVVAVDAAGNVSASSAAATVTPKDTTPPSAPTNLTGAAGDTQVSLSWTRSPQADTARYLVRDASGATVATTTGTSAVVTGLTDGTAYTFTVVAVDTSGNVSAASNQVSLTPVDTTAPSAPANLAAAAGDTTATLSWTKSPESDVDHYTVRNSAGTTVATVPATGSSVTLTGLTNGTPSSYTVVAVDRVGNVSPASSAVTVTPIDTTAPTTPASAGSSAGDGRVTVTWTASTSTDVDHYDVVDQNGITRASAASTATSVVVTGLTNGTTYTFTVVAVDGAGNRSTSASAGSATPVAAALPTPAGVSATGSDGAATVTWTAVTDPRVDHYQACSSSGTCSDVAKGTTSATFPGLTNGTSYAFTVYSVDTAGNRSPVSAPATATPRAAALPAPTGVTAAAGDSSAAVSWNPVNGATGYEVTTDAGTTVSVTGPAATLTGLTNGRTYRITVRAVAGDGTRGATAVAVSVTPAAAATGTPVAGAGAASGTVVSRDGSVTLFGTTAQLEASDTNASYELYVRNNTTGISRRLDPSAEAASSDLGQSQVAVSGDGRYAALVTSLRRSPQDVNTLPDVYRVDLNTGTWILASAVSGGSSSTATAGTTLQKAARIYASSPSVAISGDGTKVFYFSDRTDLISGDTNKATDLFATDVTTGAVTRVSVTATGGQLTYGVQGPALAVTPDGRYVTFVAKQANLLSAWRKDLQTGALDSVAGSGSWGGSGTNYSVAYDARELSLSDDGRYVAFASDSSALTSGAAEFLVYRRDMAAGGKIVRAGLPDQKVDWEHQVALDPTGRYAFFETTASYGSDNDGHTDWYRRDLDAGTVAMVTTTAAGTPSATRMTGSVTVAEYGSITVLSGDAVLVTTMQALIASDTNKASDIYRKTISTNAVSSAV
ncbi:beta strand repeat-containing protein [Kineococcus sp. R86509]|uniref:beta strand repeat-containing protein n=1 Tax=Kineococcus sp. R86509 TaxID=3093851 RepID=UPI0036D23D9D